MKKRNTAIATFLLLAAVSLGVGYAALTDSFNIHGDVGANKDNENLVCVLDGETANSSVVSTVDGTYCQWATSEGAAAIDGRTDCELKFVSLTTKGQTATADLVVENRSINDNSLIATLSAPAVTHNLDTNVFDVSVAWDWTVTAENPTPVIKPNEHAVLKISVSLKTTPTNAIDASSLTISFTATTK